MGEEGGLGVDGLGAGMKGRGMGAPSTQTISPEGPAGRWQWGLEWRMEGETSSDPKGSSHLFSHYSSSYSPY